MEKLISKRYPILILLSAVFVMIAYHVFAYIGHYGYDDVEYARLAAQVINGTPDFSNHFTFRFTLVLTTALSYALFGISDFSSALPAMLATTVILLTVYLLLRRKSTVQLAIGLIITLLSHWFIFYSDKLMPDIFVALSVILAVFAVYRFRYQSNGKNPLAYAVFLTAALLFGFMSKGTILLILPWLAYLFTVDIFSHKNIRFWVFTFVSGVGFLALYFFGIYLLTGSLSSRFDALSANAYLNSCSYDRQSLSILIERLTTGFSEMGIQSGLFAAYIFVFAALVNRNLRRTFLLKNSESYFLVSAVLLLLSANFMSISPTSYIPMCLDVRHYLYLFPVAAIPASKVISDFLKSGRHRFAILFFVVLATVLARFINTDIYDQLYLPLTILFAAFVFFKLKKKLHWAFVLLMVYIFAQNPYHMVLYAKQIGYRFQKDFVFSQILDTPQSAYILTNPVEMRLGEYYGKFKDEKHIFLDFQNFDPDTLDNRKRYLLRNGYTEYLSGLNNSNIPMYIQQIDSSVLVARDSHYKLALFDASGLKNPRTAGKLFLRSTYDFESPARFWNASASARVTHPVYKGKFAENAGEYSATFVLPLDSIDQLDCGDLYIWCQVYTYFENKTTAELVASIEDSTGTLSRKAVPANPFQKAFSNWWPVTLDFQLPHAQLNSGSVLKVYLWNPDKTPAYIDDFSVEVRSIP